MDAHILLSPVGQKTETRFNCFLTENRKSTEMMVEARCYQNDSWSARRVIGATAKPLYPIDGKAAGFDRRIPQDLPLRGRGTAPWAVEGVRNPDGGRRSPRSPENSALTLHMLHMLLMPRMLKAYDVCFKNHQVSFRRMSRYSACFFIESTYFEIITRLKFQKNADL